VVGTQTGGFVVRILSGLATGGEPLYVIDGHMMLVDPNRGIDWFKLDEIERINVLKTPDETSVYGPRGAHGVILITTKQGSRSRGYGAQAAPAAHERTLVRALRRGY
jgi:TonB-dependent SusC/RagA subfamily outer membrane receptor